MNTASFLAHHGLTENPFNAEEARHDPVFARLSESSTTHPDFHKILGRIDSPSTSIVFGEKGSGKTAIRLLIGKKVAEHNAAYPDSRTLLIPYDDLNPMLDRLQRHHAPGGSAQDVLQRVRLSDHQDAILSLATTRLVDALLGEAAEGGEPMPLPDALAKRIKKMPRRVRADLLLLAALYDQPPSGALAPRWRSLAKALRLGTAHGMGTLKFTGIALTAIALGTLVAHFLVDQQSRWALHLMLALTVAGALAAWGAWAWQHVRLWRIGRRVRREMPAIERSVPELRAMLGGIRTRDREHAALPGLAASKDAASLANSEVRYQLTRRLLDVLGAFGYRGVIVLVDRVDEPTLISGHPDRMRPVVWPILDNKFLQQDHVGVILLLPIELRYLVQRESSEFYQHARLDKQSMIDRLSWSGATLYDLCTARLRACRSTSAGGESPLGLTDLFEPEVTREMLIDALDQMHQPRDAFKFLYAVIQEHCRTVPEDQPQWRIPRLTLEGVRRGQSQRVQELFRGLAPA